MSGSVVADFVASARYDASPGAEPVKARILLSEDRLVLASDAGRTAIPLSDVVDVIASGVPEELGGFFDQSVLIAYDAGDRRRTAVVTGDHDPVDKFALFLYKAALRGEGTVLRHPSRVGGRVVDADPQAVSVSPTAEGVRFVGEDVDLELALEDVVDVTREHRSVGGRERPVLAVSHHADGRTETTEIAHENPNHLTLLARHLRSEYVGAREILEEADLDDREIAVLVALYAGVEPDALGRVLQDDAADSGEILATLAEEGLVVDGADNELTHEGALVAIHRIETVAE